MKNGRLANRRQMNERCVLLAQKEEEVLKCLADGGQVEKEEFDRLEKEMLELLMDIPKQVALHNQNSDCDESQVVTFIQTIEKIRKQVQLGISILNEANRNPSQGKIRNMVLTWNMWEAVI